MLKHHMTLSKSSAHMRQSAQAQYAAWVESGTLSNFLMLFGYPLTAYTALLANLDEGLAPDDPCVYVETASARLLRLCRRAQKRRSLVQLGHFESTCPFRSVFLEGRIVSVTRTAAPAVQVQVSRQPAQTLRTYRICIRPREWVFSYFVGSSARNKQVQAGNFNVQLKARYRRDVLESVQHQASPCDDTDHKEEIFTHACSLHSRVNTQT